MELSIKKINRAMESFIDKENYKYYPDHFSFDYVSDPDYVYMCVERIYFIRVPRKDMPDILSALKEHPQIVTDFKAEECIQKLLVGSTEYHIKEVIDHPYKKKDKVVVFENYNGETTWINARFFKEFYNNNIVDKGVPANITFTAIDDKHPLVMWEDDEAIGTFCPIRRK